MESLFEESLADRAYAAVCLVILFFVVLGGGSD